MDLKLRAWQDDNNPSILLCPKCGCDYITHQTVEVFDRKEDELKALHVVVDQNKVVIDQNLSGKGKGKGGERCQDPFLRKGPDTFLLATHVQPFVFASCGRNVDLSVTTFSIRSSDCGGNCHETTRAPGYAVLTPPLGV